MSKRLNTVDFIRKATAVHGSKYDYINTCYTSAHDPVIITCYEHGDFRQKANDHLQARGCAACANKARSSKTKSQKSKTTAQFVSDAIKKHGRVYKYSHVQYESTGKKVSIECRKHGLFEQWPSAHLSGSGCPKCANKRVSAKENSWLDSLDIPVAYRQTLLRIDDRNVSVDGYDPGSNIVYEYNGNFWHGNPEMFEQQVKHPMINGTFGDVYRRTLKKEKLLRDHGYIVCTIWEDSDMPVYSKRINNAL